MSRHTNSSTINRYTPVPPITPSVDQTSDEEESTSTTVDDDDHHTTDEEDEEEDVLDEDFQLSEEDFDDVKPALKKRMLALSNLETFDVQVRNSL